MLCTIDNSVNSLHSKPYAPLSLTLSHSLSLTLFLSLSLTLSLILSLYLYLLSLSSSNIRRSWPLISWLWSTHSTNWLCWCPQRYSVNKHTTKGQRSSRHTFRCVHVTMTHIQISLTQYAGIAPTTHTH